MLVLGAKDMPFWSDAQPPPTSVRTHPVQGIEGRDVAAGKASGLLGLRHVQKQKTQETTKQRHEGGWWSRLC